MKADEIRQSFLDFFKKRGHTIVPSSSLLTKDSSVLLTTAGMQQFKEYYLGKTSPYGEKAASCQKCFRTSDIEEAGDSTHLTFLEMLGNFSFGDYFKKEAIQFAYDFLIKERKIPLSDLYVTYFKGDKDVPEDKESQEIWQGLGIRKETMFGFGREDNFWGPTGEEGPCGPTTEMHFVLTKKPCAKKEKCGPNCDCGRFLEVWNLVFNEYFQDKDKKLSLLEKKGVDTGMGFERLTAVVQKKASVYETDLFWPIIDEISKNSVIDYFTNPKAFRIIADHIKGVVFLASEKIIPSNTEEGYILRRVLRRAIRYGKVVGLPSAFLIPLANKIIEMYCGVYPELKSSQSEILTVIKNEEEKFSEALNEGLERSKRIFGRKTPISQEKYAGIMEALREKNMFREIYRAERDGKESGVVAKFGVKITPEEIKKATISGEEAFDLYQSYGFPLEMLIELVQARNLFIDIESFEEEKKKHQEISRAGVEKKFGGVGKEATYEATKLHTATHLLHWALREVLGKHVKQMGSDITSQRLRFDFSHLQKMSLEEIKKVEELVNQIIKGDIKVVREEKRYEDAISDGALAFFKEKYPEKVSVYTVGNFSKEICAGPHVLHTGELKEFKIVKEESAGAGIRRIRAVLEEEAL